MKPDKLEFQKSLSLLAYKLYKAQRWHAGDASWDLLPNFEKQKYLKLALLAFSHASEYYKIEGKENNE